MLKRIPTPTPAGIRTMSSVCAPLRLTDAQMATVTAAARQLPWASRSDFLQRVAQELHDRADPGDGDVDRALRAALAVWADQQHRWIDPG